jgi:hypothetical protein
MPGDRRTQSSTSRFQRGRFEATECQEVLPMPKTAQATAWVFK